MLANPYAHQARASGPPAPDPAARLHTLSAGPDGAPQAGVEDFSPAERLPVVLVATAPPAPRICPQCNGPLPIHGRSDLCPRCRIMTARCADCHQPIVKTSTRCRACKGKARSAANAVARAARLATPPPLDDAPLADLPIPAALLPLADAPPPDAPPALDATRCAACQERGVMLAGVCRDCYQAFLLGRLDAAALARLRAMPPAAPVLRPCARYELGCRRKAQANGYCNVDQPAPLPSGPDDDDPIPAWIRRGSRRAALRDT